MSKSIKLNDDNYWDSTGIVHNKQKLSDILDNPFINLTFNEDYIYSTDRQYTCLKIGKVVILNIHTIAFSQETPNDTYIIYGLPKPKENIVFALLGNNSAQGGTTRCVLLKSTGNIRIHYGAPGYYGASSTRQYNGILIYETSE